MQSPAPASSLAEPPPAAKAHNRGGGSVSRGCDPRGCVVCCWCLLLPGCCCCCAAAAAAAAASTTTALLAFLRLGTFRTGKIILELATTTAVSIFYLCSLQPRQAASLSRLRQQAHNWGGGSVSRGCDPRESGICCCCLLLPVLLLLLLLPRRRLPFLVFLRLVTLV